MDEEEAAGCEWYQVKMKQKRTFLIIFVVTAISLAILPFIVSFNELLTHLVERLQLYMWVQERVVPTEIRMVGLLVRLLGVDFQAHRDGLTVNGIYARMTWNCIGWQSLLLFLVTLPFGLRGGYTTLSRVEAVVLGILGIFLVNILRMSIIVVILAFSRPLFAVVFHDYFAAIITVIYLFVFWWFVYSFVLEERKPSFP